MKSNQDFTVWIGEKCIPVSPSDVNQIRSISDSNLRCFSDLAIAAMIADSRYAGRPGPPQNPRIDVLNRTELRLLTEARQSIRPAS